MTGRASQRRKRGSGVPESYDFRQPLTLTREHARAMEVSLTTFARQWGPLLTSRLGAATTIALDSVELKTYEDYIHALPQTTTAIVLTQEPSRTPVLLQVPTDITMTMVDCLLGGPAAALAMPFRELTEIEWKLLGEVLSLACSELTYGLQSVAPMKFEVKGVKYNPGFMQIMPAAELVLVGTFELTVGPVTAPLTLMMLAEPMLEALRGSDEESGRSEQEQQEHAAALHLLAERMTEVPLPVSVRFAGRTLAASQIAGLEVGSVISLGHPATRPLDVVVGDITLAHAAIGANGTRIACLVVSTEEEA